jgi:hypothetical protein
MDEERRRVLQTLGLVGLGGLAGCQEQTPESESKTTSASNSETATNSKSTTSADAERSTSTQSTLTIQTSVTQTDTGRRLTVSGEATAPEQITAVDITVEETTKSESFDSEPPATFSIEFEVEGGQKYNVSVRAETSADTELTTTETTDYVPLTETPATTDRLVGAHYYPWYGMQSNHENWTDSTVSTPVLGEYDSDERSVVDQHLTWCLNHGINWLSVSWWGKDSGSDAALSNGLLEAEKFDQLSFSILYETTRLEQYGYNLDAQETRAHLLEDFQYLEENFFSKDNYLEFDGRPVVFFWISHALQGDAEAAFAEITNSLNTDLYILAGLPFGQSLGTEPMSAVADGVTSYNPYAARKDIEAVFHDTYAQGLQTMNLSTRATDVDFFPVVIPGFNDTAIPDSQREDNPVLSASPARYERVCEQVQPHLADSRAVLITSFNEWYENTQIEPNTQYGTQYLQTTANRLATGESTGFNPEGKTLRFEFNDTFMPQGGDDRQLAFLIDELTIYAGTEQLAEFDIGVPGEEPTFLLGAFPSESSEGESWRWFGGPAAEAAMFIPGQLDGVDRAVLRGYPMRSDKVSATVYFDGEQTDQVVFGRREMDSFEIDI